MALDIKSKHALVRRSPAELYMNFTDMRNLIAMLPEDKKQGIQADFDSISGTVQGFPLGVRVNERLPYSKIDFQGEGSPFPFAFTLHFDQSPEGDYGRTDFHIDMSAELNFMMKKMLGGKLQEALDKIVDGIAAVSEGRVPEGLNPDDFQMKA